MGLVTVTGIRRPEAQGSCKLMAKLRSESLGFRGLGLRGLGFRF